MDATRDYNNEHSQVVVRGTNGALRGEKVHIGKDNSDEIRIGVRLQDGESVAAIIHSHFPGGGGPEQFSGVDIDTGKSLPTGIPGVTGVPIYVVGPNWSIRSFDPRADTITEILP